MRTAAAPGLQKTDQKLKTRLLQSKKEEIWEPLTIRAKVSFVSGIYVVSSIMWQYAITGKKECPIYYLLLPEEEDER
ncbi:hypothetical protein ACFPU1_00585 [Thalassorhabdus alkalitolerans]|uniref:Uncharacterized protein n=1 Tax=Thalassorhabdus alkalitolerans TaxID=2282697 RepID=A0ABW0YLI0_9BACI|nr:hypothetical protein [Thalassobacillus sp. C254]